MAEKKLGRYVFESFFELLVCVLAIIPWIAGTVLAPGWWKIAAFIFPPYPWYLVAEKIMQSQGWS